MFTNPVELTEENIHEIMNYLTAMLCEHAVYNVHDGKQSL